MTDYNRNKGCFLRAVLSVMLGAVAAIVAFFILISLFFALGLFGWSDGGEVAYLKRLETTTNITTLISAILAIVVFVIIVIRINKQNRDE